MWQTTAFSGKLVEVNQSDRDGVCDFIIIIYIALALHH